MCVGGHGVQDAAELKVSLGLVRCTGFDAMGCVQARLCEVLTLLGTSPRPSDSASTYSRLRHHPC